MSDTLGDERRLLENPWIIAAVGVVLALATAVLARGRVHADEIFQYLEPAHRLVFGTWQQAWEWQEGLRNWAVPGAIAGLLEALSFLGVSHPLALAFGVAVACALVQGLGTVALFRLVEERDGREAAVLAAWVHATWGGWFIFASRPLGDSFSAAPLLGALYFAYRARQRDGARDGFLAGVMLGLAFVMRYPSAVFGFPVAASLLLGKRFRSFGTLMAGGLLVVGALAVLDWITWGQPLASAWRHTTFNMSGQVAVRFGSRPIWAYPPLFASMVPLLLAWHFLVGLKRRDLVVGTFATYFLVMSAIPHKEARFLAPLIPLYVVIAAGPAALFLRNLRETRGRSAIRGLVALQVVLSILSAAATRTFGFHTDEVDSWVDVGRDPSLRKIVALYHWIHTGGRFYLGRDDVPAKFLEIDKVDPSLVAEALDDPKVSHVLLYTDSYPASKLEAGGYRFWRTEGEISIWRRSP